MLRKTIIISYVIVIAAILSLLAGCGYKYTVVADNSLKLSTISKTNIAVLPVSRIYYSPPQSCLFPADLSNEPSLRNDWDETIRLVLEKNFPEQKFTFVKNDDSILNQATYDLSAIYSLAERNITAQKVSVLNSSKVDYAPMQTNPALQDFFNEVRTKKDAQYAVFFLSPSLSGEIQSTYTYNGNGMGSSSSTIYYTADIQIQIWDCTTSRLMYSSGGWDKSSGFCFFISAENMAMKNSAKIMIKNLYTAISYLLDNMRPIHISQLN